MLSVTKLALLVSCATMLWSLAMPTAQAALQPVHVAFLTDCTMYSDWQSLGMIYSFKMSGQPGKITRVMCCSEAEKAKYSPELLKEVETHIAPSFTIHPVTHDHYAAYNKPEAVIDWLQHVTPAEEYILVLDSDMILRRPFLVEVMQPKPGLAVGARYSYMIGVNNELALRHVPEVIPRNDTLAGPMGRRGDQVGGFFFIQRDDLKRMSTLWLKYTEDVRADEMAYKYSGDVYAIHPGDKPWISEMYGYAYGAAKADVWHKWDTTSMIYPQYEPHGTPKLMHYGLLFAVNDYKFDKHWHYDFDVKKCPPWDLSDPQHRTAGLFAHPPRISSLTNQATITAYYRDLLSMETVATMNAGFCDYHVKNCPASKQLYEECKLASEIYHEIAAEARKVEASLACMDFHEKCASWQQQGECEKNKLYMEDNCRKSCNACSKEEPMEGLTPPSDELERNLAKMAKDLGVETALTDPDANKAAGEQLVAGGQTGADPDAAKASTTSPPPSPPPPLPPPPSPPPPVLSPPPPPPPPEPKAVQAYIASPVGETSSPLHEAGASTVPSTKTRKELVVRCYRLSLGLEEVKDCVDAAKDSREYQRAPQAMSPPEVAELITAEAASHLEDLTLTSSPAVAPSELTQPPQAVVGPRVLSKMPTLQVLGLVSVVVILLLALLFPRLVRLKKKAKSGKRTE